MSGWIFIHSGHWFDPPSHVIDDLWLPSGTEKLSFDLPDDTEPGDSYLRLRFSTLPGLWFCGFAPDGETQDYWVDIKSFSGVDDSKGMPSEYKLHPNIPNPFNPSTRLSYDIPAASNVRLTIYNLRGQEIRTLASGQQPAGRHTVIWDGCDNSGRLLPGGIYFAIFKAGDYKTSQKLLLLK
ncbi:MAG: FlgD immunoglobulin-like domain containing protein [candidate division KSB1 bacterium]|nr:FlgD immunoglobulin-like domain containing protein [candidate division KSB1 bacterium]